MLKGDFRVGQRLTLKDQPHRVLRDLGEGTIAVEELTTGRIQERRIPDLLEDWRAGDLVFGDRAPLGEDAVLLRAIAGAHQDAFLQSYSERQQSEAKRKLVFVERLEALPRTGDLMTTVIKETWGDQSLWKGVSRLKAPPHFTTVARWIHAYTQASRDIRALVTRHSGKGNGAERVDPIIRTMVDDLIQTRYLTEERPTLKAIRKELKELVAQRNATRLPKEQLRTPAYAYLKRHIYQIAPYDVHRARYGQRAADLKFRAAAAPPLTLHPLARASMDHCRMDVFVVDERTRLPLGRPWLTVVIDEYSRYILGYYLSFEEPSSVSMSRALRNALAVKEPSQDVKANWDAWGVMDTLVVDNGLEFHGHALEAGAGRFGITIQFCPRRKPWYKGKVERFFGTLNSGLMTGMKGKTFSSLVMKGDYDPAKHAVMTLETLRRVVHMWIVDVYHHEVHRGIGMTPSEAWTAGVEQIDRYLPPSSVIMESAFSTSSLRRLTHKGIEFDQLFYNSHELRMLRELHGSEINVEVRTYDDNLGSIVVVAPDGATIIKVPAVSGEYAEGLTRWQHRVCKRYQRRMQEDDAREISLLDARNRIRSLIEQDMQLSSRRSRNKQQRFMQRDGAAQEPATMSQPPPERERQSETSNEACVDAALPNATSAQDSTTGAEIDDIPEFSSRRVAGGDE